MARRPDALGIGPDPASRHRPSLRDDERPCPPPASINQRRRSPPKRGARRCAQQGRRVPHGQLRVARRPRALAWTPRTARPASVKPSSLGGRRAVAESSRRVQPRSSRKATRLQDCGAVPRRRCEGRRSADDRECPVSDPSADAVKWFSASSARGIGVGRSRRRAAPTRGLPPDPLPSSARGGGVGLAVRVESSGIGIENAIYSAATGEVTRDPRPIVPSTSSWWGEICVRAVRLHPAGTASSYRPIVVRRRLAPYNRPAAEQVALLDRLRAANR